MPLLTELVAICVAVAIKMSLLRSCFSDRRVLQVNSLDSSSFDYNREPGSDPHLFAQVTGDDTDRNSELLFDLSVEEPLDRVRGIGIVTLVGAVADKR
jgi:hypothetical protein